LLLLFLRWLRVSVLLLEGAVLQIALMGVHQHAVAVTLLGVVRVLMDVAPAAVLAQGCGSVARRWSYRPLTTSPEGGSLGSLVARRVSHMAAPRPLEPAQWEF